jgi:hypothetical protein
MKVILIVVRQPLHTDRRVCGGGGKEEAGGVRGARCGAVRAGRGGGGEAGGGGGGGGSSRGRDSAKLRAPLRKRAEVQAVYGRGAGVPASPSSIRHPQK